MKYCILIICVLIVAILIVSKRKPDVLYVEDKKRINELMFKMDSLQIEHELLISHYVRLQKSLEVSREETRRALRKYKNEKNKPVVNYTDHQLDSILSVLYPD